MFHGKKIVVVMPAYNAARTIEQTYREIPLDLVDEVIVTDDASRDETVEVAKRLGLRTIVHDFNRGYGGNQKTCYSEALRLGGDVVVMLHPDYQYTPKLIPAMIGLITDGPYDRTQRIVNSLRLEILSGGDDQNLRVRRVFETPYTVYRIELENPEMNYQRTTLLDGDALEELLQTDGVRDRLKSTLA